MRNLLEAVRNETIAPVGSQPFSASHNIRTIDVARESRGARLEQNRTLGVTVTVARRRRPMQVELWQVRQILSFVEFGRRRIGNLWKFGSSDASFSEHSEPGVMFRAV